MELVMWDFLKNANKNKLACEKVLSLLYFHILIQKDIAGNRAESRNY